MSPSAWITLVVLGIVAVILYRQHRREKGYFAGARPEARRHDQPPLSAKELGRRTQALRAVLAQHPLPSVRITPHARKPELPWQSRFGGVPYWPRGLAYPATPEGRPLYMLAQLNLAEVPSLPGYPAEGMLQFFTADDDLMGLVLVDGLALNLEGNSNGQRSRVVYHPRVIENVDALDRDVPHASQADGLPLHDEYAVSFERIDELPAPTDHRFHHVTASLAPIHEDVMEVVWEEQSGAGSKLGGYANFTQEDPRCSLSPGEWLLLFQLDTAGEEGVDIMWGDCGVGNWFIHRDDLARRDFSRAWFNWDCC